MNFKTITSAGKNYLIQNGFKFRETRTLTNGTISWRCCNKDCSSTMKTDGKKTIIIDPKISHNHKALYTSPSLPASTTPRSHHRTPALTANTTLPASTPPPPPTPDSAPTPELIDENAALKDQLAKLQVEMESVLNHSIESDLRLTQYTTDIFSCNRTLTQKNDQSIQTEPSTTNTENKYLKEIHKLNSTIELQQKELDNARNKITTLESELNLKLNCKTCEILKQETTNMISTIRNLELNIKQIENKTQTPPAASRNSTIPLQNSFELLAEESEIEPEFKTVSKKKRKGTNKNVVLPKNKKSKLPTKKNKMHTHKIPFKNITVLGDSHARNLAALTSERTSHYTTVTGTCKPSAGLLNIAPTSTPPPQHCYVILAGTNDVAAGRQNIIYRHLEGVLKSCVKTSRVLVSAIPTRYDLPRRSPIHNTVALVNSFMEELCKRHEGVEFLDLSGLSRDHFTAHGLHLRTKGKQLVADVIVERLALMKPPPLQAKPDTKTPRKPLSSVPGRPQTLRHESFAAAARSPVQPSPEDTNLAKPSCSRQTLPEIPKSQQNFLGNPLLSPVQN